MKIAKNICLILSLIMLLTSCTSVYVTPNDTSGENDVITAEEYFTTGSVYRPGKTMSGLFYEGCWIYIEYQDTIGIAGKWSTGELVYDNVQMQRIVKYNPETGVVSSPCLDPVCNHSFESGCLMLAPHDPFGDRSVLYVDGIIGDWMIIKTQYSDKEFNVRQEFVLYNLKTGESKKEFNEELGGTVLTVWEGRSVFEDKCYKVKHVLDYAGTGYIPGGEDENISNYTPKTVCTLCEYDFDKQTLKDLFEIPEDYSIVAVTNKRFFFTNDKGEFYSCNRDGSNMKKEDVLNFSPENRIGTYAYKFSDVNGFIVYDLTTNEMKSVIADYDEYKKCILTNDGVIFDYISSYEASQEFIKNKNKFFAEHPDMDMSQIVNEYSKELDRIFHSGKAQIFKTDFVGENVCLIYEEENAVIQTIFATSKYLFAYRSTLDADGNTLNMHCVINLETGEITELPYLDIVVPDWYVNIK